MPNETKKLVLEVSEATYNEIAFQLTSKGVKLEPGQEITITKDISLKNPLDLRMISIRKDATDIAAKICGEDGNLISLAKQVTEFIVHGTTSNTPEMKGWGK